MTETTAPAVPTLSERMQSWAEHGITVPHIIEREWRGIKPVSPDNFQADMLYVAQLRARAYEWRGACRDGSPLIVVWWAGARAGQLFSAYEITQEAGA
ncbi:hypothetical protein [Streptomyces sp. t39]|uniref:hypothetical protein n=1 Tax=Streptomyces sp. t39 TaxID=1828156 RepID=UPI0011CD4074|nr:hypothetical protein [Streptomyces sp. t39]TXS35262.1 hypothetical protein EAO77_37225 [Streptomyces sp. t39]